MSEATAQYSLRVQTARISRGTLGGVNAIKQSVGNGITITSQNGALDINQPTNTDIEINDAQVTGLFGYIGLLNAGIDTSAIETAVATLVAAS